MKNVNRVASLGLLVVSTGAVLCSCNSKGVTEKPHITVLGGEYLDVTYNNLEFNKDVEVHIKPKEKSHSHLRKFDFDEGKYVGEDLKPFVGLGNPTNTTSSPLIENLSYTYAIQDKEKEEYVLKIPGKYFTNSVVISYRSYERSYTKQGQIEMATIGDTYDISNLFETSPYMNNISIVDTNIDKNLVSVYPKDCTLTRDYQQFYFYENRDTDYYKINDIDACIVVGVTKDGKEVIISQDDIKFSYSTGYETCCVTINNSVLFDKDGETPLYENLYFDPYLDVKSKRPTINVKDSTNFSTVKSNNKFANFYKTPFFEGVEDEKAYLEVNNTFIDFINTLMGGINAITNYSWVSPTTKFTSSIDESKPEILSNFDIAPCVYDVDQQNETPLSHTITAEDTKKCKELDDKLKNDSKLYLNNYFESVIKYTIQDNAFPYDSLNGTSYYVFVPRNYANPKYKVYRKDMLVLFDADFSDRYQSFLQAATSQGIDFKIYFKVNETLNDQTERGNKYTVIDNSKIPLIQCFNGNPIYTPQTKEMCLFSATDESGDIIRYAISETITKPVDLVINYKYSSEFSEDLLEDSVVLEKVDLTNGTDMKQVFELVNKEATEKQQNFVCLSNSMSLQYGKE